AGLAPVVLPDRHAWSRGRRWHGDDRFWERLDGVRRRIHRGRDVSVDAFLRAHDEIPARARQLVRAMVEGYHAAHPERMSITALGGGDDEQDPASRRQQRLPGGYDSVITWLAAGSN